MCGITGFVGQGQRRDLLAMTGALSHRGPDQEGYYLDSELPVFLGSRRLVIRDTEGGVQPLASEDEQTWLIFNGEIYNAAELREQLQQCGHRFRSQASDSEVVLHAYRQWGVDLFAHLNGMWALALLDRKRGQLLLSRDPFGQKPLYVTRQGSLFAFASEPGALTQHRGLDLKLSELGLRKYCAHGYFPGEHSLYHGVRKLPPGHWLRLNLNDLESQQHCYWRYRIEPQGDCSETAAEHWAQQLRERLLNSVRRRLVSDAPVGFFLSGGLDSSAIIACAAAAGTRPLRSFSIGFSESSFDESEEALRAAHAVGSTHRVKVFSKELVEELVDEIFKRLDEPLSDSSMLSFYLLCREARRDVKVALGGDAGDELLAGYAPFHALRFAGLAEQLLPRPIHRGISALMSRIPPSHSNMSTRFKIDRAMRGLGHGAALWNPLWLAPVSPPDLEELLGEPIDLEELYSEAIEAWDGCESDHPVDRSLEFYGRVFLTDDILVKVDRLSMLHGLEVRSPFLDPELIDCIRRIPHGLKLKGSTTKYILKRAVAPLLPADIIHRRKLGFSAPLGSWLAQGALRPDPDNLPGSWRSKALRQRLQRHRSGHQDHRLLLWNLLALSEVMRHQPSRTISTVRPAATVP